MFDKGQSTQTDLAPALAVLDVFLQQQDERCHRCVVPGSPGSTHRADQMLLLESLHEGVGPDLTVAIRVHDPPGHRAASGDSADQGVHRELGTHLRVHGVAHVAPGIRVPDGAEIEFALVGPGLGAIRQPPLVEPSAGELALEMLVEHGWAEALPALPTLSVEHGPPLVVPADPPGDAFANFLTGASGVGGQQA